jgi:transposase
VRTLYAGLDVSYGKTSICIVDVRGKVVHRVEVETTPAAISAALMPFRRNLKLVGQESGNLAAWLQRGLTRNKFPMVCLDARHASSALGASINKTDTNDARGLALLLARGVYATAHVKTEEAIRIKTVLSLREAIVHKANDLRRASHMALKLNGHSAPPRRRLRQSTVRNAVASAFESVAKSIKVLADHRTALDAVVAELASESPICQRLMTIPGVGPITALTFVAAVDDPYRFKSSRTVAAYFGLTPRTYQSGNLSVTGRISRRGNANVRKTLYVAANSLISRSGSKCSLKRWAVRLRKQKGLKIACVACARKLAVLMHHLWVTGQDFDPER